MVSPNEEKKKRKRGEEEETAVSDVQRCFTRHVRLALCFNFVLKSLSYMPCCACACLSPCIPFGVPICTCLLCRKGAFGAPVRVPWARRHNQFVCLFPRVLFLYLAGEWGSLWYLFPLLCVHCHMMCVHSATQIHMTLSWCGQFCSGWYRTM